MSKKYHLFTSLALCLGILFYACDSGGDDDGPAPPEFDRAAMLTNYADNLILPGYRELQTSTDQFKAAVDAFEAEATTANLEALRSNFKTVRLAWQKVNFFQFGPAETNTLRTILNTYPADTDKIEMNIDNGGYTLGSVDNIAAGGFPAVAYLIYGQQKTDQEILEDFTSQPNAMERLTYLTDNADFIKTAIDAVTNAWEPSGGDYRATFLDSSNGGTGTGSSTSLMTNALIQHYERFLRDGKIGIPAGVRSAGVPRPTATEAYHGGYSSELVVANLQAFKSLLTGGTGSGLDDNLRFLQEDQLVTDILAGLDQAISDAQQLSDPLSSEIENDPQPAIDVFTSMQEALVLIKVDMTSALGITITFQDNDGD